MLIFLWPVPEAFVLTEVVNAASDNWRSPPVVWLVPLDSQGGGTEGTAARLLLIQQHQLSC